MTLQSLLIAHAVKVMLLVALVFIVVRGHYRECWSFAAYLVTAFSLNSLVTFWPGTFFNHEFYLLGQAMYDVLKLLVGIEIARRVFRGFPGALPLVQRVVFVLILLTTAAFFAIPRRVRFDTWFVWQPRIVASTVWLFTATSFLILWFRVPVRRWHRDLLLSFTAYLLVFVTLLGLLRERGWDFRSVFATLDALAYLALVAWWAWAATRPQERIDMAPAVARRLGLESSHGGTRRDVRIA